MSNVKVFNACNSNAQNDLNAKIVDVLHSNVECQNDLNLKIFDVGHSISNVECQTV